MTFEDAPLFLFPMNDLLEQPFAYLEKFRH